VGVPGDNFTEIESLLEELCESIHGYDRLTLWDEVREVQLKKVPQPDALNSSAGPYLIESARP
jgi:hypothetical protein